MSSHPSLTLVFTRAHTLLHSLVKTYLGRLVYLEMIAVQSGSSMSVSACTFLGSGHMPCWQIISPKNRMLVQLKRHLSLLNFTFACLHTLSALCNVSSWPLLCLSKPVIKMLSAIPTNIWHTTK